MTACISVTEVAVGPVVRKGFPEKPMSELTSDPGRLRMDMGRRSAEGAEDSQEEATTCAKALSHFICLSPSDSHKGS